MPIIKTQGELQLTFDFINGGECVLHSEKSPAVFASHTQCWFLNGKIHRSDGPAIIYDKNVEWGIDFEISRFFVNPSSEIIHSQISNNRLWYIHGQNLTLEIEHWLKENKIRYPFSKNNLLFFHMRWL